MPEEMIKVAESRVAMFIQVKSKIDTKMTEIHEIIDSVKQIVKANARCYENPDGLLIQKEDAYIACLELQNERLK